MNCFLFSDLSLSSRLPSRWQPGNKITYLCWRALNTIQTKLRELVSLIFWPPVSSLDSTLLHVFRCILHRATPWKLITIHEDHMYGPWNNSSKFSSVSRTKPSVWVCSEQASTSQLTARLLLSSSCFLLQYCEAMYGYLLFFVGCPLPPEWAISLPRHIMTACTVRHHSTKRTVSRY